jgi:predicted  nucleic acid-binding Zn-ribbon protein
VARLDAEVARLDAEVARLDAEVARLDAEVARITTHERDLERQLREGYQTEIDRLVAEIDVVRRQERLAAADLERLRASRSWKMTAPLRAATERRPKP